MKDLLYKIALTKIPLVGAVTAKNLISYCGSAQQVFEKDEEHLRRIPGVGDLTARNILQQSVLDAAEKEIEFIEKQGITPLFYLDKNFPQRLRNLHDAPVMLYYKGTANLNARRTVGIIGTRTPTAHGLSSCEEIVEGLAPYKPLIISGLAYGIDIAAHRKCLATRQETVAVLGHGLSKIYPMQHRKTAVEMMAHGGLVTEFPSHVSPEKENFPMRNRIVAGLCDVLVVVESALTGGSLITVRQSRTYEREVFAVPGRVRDKFSQGCNALIKMKQATLIENAGDIARVLRWNKPVEDDEPEPLQQELFLELTEPEKIIVDFIHQEDEVGIDQLCYQISMNTTEVSAALLALEFKGLVRSLPGKRYVLR